MRNNLLILVIVLFLPVSAFAKDSGKKEFWIGKYGEATENELVRRAHKVFKNVLEASDKRAGVTPSFHVIKYSGSPWAQSLADGSVILTKKGLDFCYKGHDLESGDARLAFVLGHELAHQFNGDFWQYKFFRTADEDKDNRQAFQDIKELAKDPDMLAARELQADQYGIIYAALAGYDSGEIVSDDKNFFLEYAAKTAPDSKELAEFSEKRVKAVSMRLDEVSGRLVLFELGVISYRIGRYDDALRLFERFATYFPGREVYSNIGTIHLKRNYTPSGAGGFHLSFDVDTKTRAENITVASGEEPSLSMAIENLKKAADFDPRYQDAKNGLGCAYILEGKYYDAVSVLEDALKLDPKRKSVQNNLAVAYLLLSKEVGSESLKEKARKLLVSAKEGDDSAIKNLDRLSQKHAEASAAPFDYFDDEGDFTVNFSSELKPGMDAPKSGFETVEEMPAKGKKTLSVLRYRSGKVFLLAANGKIRLAVYKALPGLKVESKGGERGDIVISGNKGAVISKNRPPDYFEF